MMGVGKSTIGKKLAKNLQRRFVDIDKIIEIKEKKTIKEIFENEGEHYFRKIEKKITLEELKKNNLIIALGGGAFINTSIRREIKSSCLSFWLDLKVESLLKNKGFNSLGMEGEKEGNWVLLDYGEFMVHVFHPEIRKYYNLEGLYSRRFWLDYQKNKVTLRTNKEFNA